MKEESADREPVVKRPTCLPFGKDRYSGLLSACVHDNRVSRQECRRFCYRPRSRSREQTSHRMEAVMI